ncbi:FAD-binding protein [Uliginosibacterium sp. H3]|uniref:FAD-binding protein n=1 Tax=Uliginosibacterium silvisoli TaxID=3114758 RepID=A0ABU6JYK5_9RHOO|nr:FAD-binding protein [Uliginosibacterium sp. H3]
MSNEQIIVNDATGLNPVSVWAVSAPVTVEDVQEAVRRTKVPISVGGGRFSMGGQTGSPGSLHLDMRKLNKVLFFAPQEKIIRVQAGVRWCDIQRFIDPHDLSVKIMQSYANFTVGGSLSVNVHGRYTGLGPLILSVRSIRLVLANGDLVDATPTLNARLFYAAIGGYGAIGVIVEAELELADNCRVERFAEKMPSTKYAEWFAKKVRNAPTAVFHNGDIYPPHYSSVRAVTWVETKRPVTAPYRLQPFRRRYALQRLMLWAVSETRFGKWRREHLYDPVLYFRRPVHWRNFEAGYDVAELEPPSRLKTTYVLQEYFVPAKRFDEFVPKLAEVLQRHRANVLNISIRHAAADPGSLLAWARGETFAFVLYHKQRTRDNARERVAVWTRELIDAVLSVGGTYYLPYQPHATPDQFHRAYPGARELFALKREFDPDYRFRNILWDKYYVPTLHEGEAPVELPDSEFHRVYADVNQRDSFYRFLQNIFHLYPEDRFHALIRQACRAHGDDSSIYRQVQQMLPQIKPFLSELTYALPALKKQKKEMLRQTLELLGDKRSISGYIEIGSTGRYISALKGPIRFRGDIVLINDVAPTNSPADIMERGGLSQIGRWLPLDMYAPISEDDVRDHSVDLVTCYIGLHHIDPPDLQPFLASIHRVLRPGGLFILRDHDVTNQEMDDFVSLAHTVFNLGLGASWETNFAEPRFFASIDDWVARLAAAGFKDSGERLLQDNDPTRNVLMAFTKQGLGGAA